MTDIERMECLSLMAEVFLWITDDIQQGNEWCVRNFARVLATLGEAVLDDEGRK